MKSNSYNIDSLVTHINEQEAFLAEENKKIYLVVLSAYFWEVLKSEYEGITTIAVASDVILRLYKGMRLKLLKV